MASYDPDPAFFGAGEKPGLQLWRVEDKQMVELPECNGKFHTGDSYILLATIDNGRALERRIHFWMGAETSQDEMGVAAIKTCELDEMLGGHPVQYREVQGMESSQFLSYFKNGGIEYLPGGVKSGFNKVEQHDSWEPRLLRVKGRRVARVTEVPLSNSSLNTGDIFILDAGLKLYVYNGASARLAEKSKAAETVNRIKNDERGGRGEIIFIHEEPECEEFWNLLGGFIEVTAEGEPDAAAERVIAESLQLLRITPEGTTEPIAKGGDFKRELLDSSEGYLLDSSNEIYTWIGRHAPEAVKKGAMDVATRYMVESNRNVGIVKVAEGTETAAFKSYFVSWTPPPMPRSPARGGPPASPARPARDARTLVEEARSSKDSQSDTPVDDGSGKLTIWRIEDFARVEWPHELYGHFYGGDSYILLYSYQNKASSKEQHIIYFWQGHDSSVDEVGASALLTVDLDNSLGGEPVQVRVTQGKEPKHFRMLFKGGMIVHSGGHASGFNSTSAAIDGNADVAAAADGGVACFHVKGTNALDTYGVQVSATAASLNSGDCFVVVTPAALYVWSGKHCSAAEADIARKIGERLQSYRGVSGREIVTVAEGKEPSEFWEALGGKGPYSETRKSESVTQAPRLFQVSNATGAMTVEEVPNFDQSDLCNDDVMLLDTVNEVYVWVGGASTERDEALVIAKTYNETATDGRPKDTPIVRVLAGSEPPIFTQHFRGWDPELTSTPAFVDPYEAKLKKLKEAQQES